MIFHLGVGKTYALGLVGANVRNSIPACVMSAGPKNGLPRKSNPEPVISLRTGFRQMYIIEAWHERRMK
jgi:hypothetical protein